MASIDNKYYWMEIPVLTVNKTNANVFHAPQTSRSCGDWNVLMARLSAVVERENLQEHAFPMGESMLKEI